MNESFLHYIWQFQYFDKTNLQLTTGENLLIIKQGIHNTDAGPDFGNAKLRIEDISWAGQVEIHIRSSEWYMHKHEHDPAYENVVLHVVWENDKPVYRQDKTLLPTLELKTRVDGSLLQSYKKLANSSSEIACEKSIHGVESVVQLSMLDKALMQRLENKSSAVIELLKTNRGDWEETTYLWLAKAFGFKVNSDPFFELAKAVSFKTLQKQKNLHEKEAMLFGVAGMLTTKTKDEYITTLYNEYRFLRKKFKLEEAELSPAQWKFLRLRPANFPTIRIAQFASLLHHYQNIFSRLIEADSANLLSTMLSTKQSPYWQKHYRFGTPAKGKVAELGESSIENLIINTVCPLLAAYGKAKDDQAYIDKAVDFLNQIAGEQNKITRQWEAIGMKIKTAFDSQACIELYTNFCKKRQCLNCNIGISILKPRQ
jgi:hypothetical protein